MSKKVKNAKTIRVESLRNANKEVKSLSGVIKLVKEFWSAGYKDAYAFANISHEDFTFDTIKEKMQKDENGVIYETRKVAVLDAAGNKVKKGRFNQYNLVNKAVKVWTPATLYFVLAQSFGLEEYR